MSDQNTEPTPEELAAIVDPFDAKELSQLQADLDAAVEAEPNSAIEWAEEVLSTTVDPNDVIWQNAGKAPAPTKFKAINGGQIVYAQVITAFRDLQDTAERFIVLSDKTERPRPITHGYIPKVGDYFVQATPITVLSDTQAYIERGETMMMGKRLFESLYYLVQE